MCGRFWNWNRADAVGIGVAAVGSSEAERRNGATAKPRKARPGATLAERREPPEIKSTKL